MMQYIYFKLFGLEIGLCITQMPVYNNITVNEVASGDVI